MLRVTRRHRAAPAALHKTGNTSVRNIRCFPPGYLLKVCDEAIPAGYGVSKVRGDAPTPAAAVPGAPQRAASWTVVKIAIVPQAIPMPYVKARCGLLAVGPRFPKAITCVILAPNVAGRSCIREMSYESIVCCLGLRICAQHFRC